RSIELDPGGAPAHHNLGLCWQAQGRLDEAVAEYRRATELDPKFARAHNKLGVCLQAQGRLEEAIAEYRRALATDPDEALAQDTLGACLSAAACTATRDAAGPAPEEAPLGEPERAGLRRQALGWLRADLELRIELLQRGKVVGWSLASWQTDAALASVRDPAALAQLPEAERRQWQRLWADVAAALAADPLDQGRAHAARREWAEAAADYVQALKLSPTDDGEIWFEYAAVLLLAGDREGYARACAHMVEKCGQAANLRAYHVARACTLAPHAVADAAAPGRLAEAEWTESAQQFWALTEQAALRYRAGWSAEAVPLLEQSLRADPKHGRAVLNWLWLALAQQRL